MAIGTILVEDRLDVLAKMRNGGRFSRLRDGCAA
jgi:hypothetical protein